ncbi:MAG: ATPase domain-containing protein, partial [Thermodesulfobacteriota bacterium]
EGRARGEQGLYVSFAETEAETREIAASHGWGLDDLSIMELVAADDILEGDAITMFHPSEVELNRTTRAILDRAERLRPARVVIDSLSEVRLLAESSLRYRRQVLALKQHLARQGTTTLLLDDRSTTPDAHLQSVAHGVLSLYHLSPQYGAERRRLRVLKLRGRTYRGGYHDFSIRRGGLEVYPRLVAAEHHEDFPRDPFSSGDPNLDALLGGGVSPGTSLLLQGPAGTGKSTLAVQFAVAAARRGARATLFLFDEGIATVMTRSQGMGLGLRELLEADLVGVRQVDPAELTPGQFSHEVRREVEERGAKIVVIDTLNGYQHAMVEEQFLLVHLHELLAYLAQRGVLTVLVLAQHGIAGPGLISAVDTSYLADTVLLFQHREVRGELRQVLSTVKKRDGRHERTVRELLFGPGGLTVGRVVSEQVPAAEAVRTGTEPSAGPA